MAEGFDRPSGIDQGMQEREVLPIGDLEPSKDPTVYPDALLGDQRFRRRISPPLEPSGRDVVVLRAQFLLGRDRYRMRVSALRWNPVPVLAAANRDGVPDLRPIRMPDQAEIAAHRERYGPQWRRPQIAFETWNQTTIVEGVPVEQHLRAGWIGHERQGAVPLEIGEVAFALWMVRREGIEVLTKQGLGPVGVLPGGLGSGVFSPIAVGKGCMSLRQVGRMTERGVQQQLFLEVEMRGLLVESSGPILEFPAGQLVRFGLPGVHTFEESSGFGAQGAGCLLYTSPSPRD